LLSIALLHNLNNNPNLEVDAGLRGSTANSFGGLRIHASIPSLGLDLRVSIEALLAEANLPRIANWAILSKLNNPVTDGS
jgi:hypothetical protein